MVGTFDNVQIVLDDHHGVAAVHQPLEHLQELAHIVGVEAGGGLVQDIDGLAGGDFAELRSQLHPLGLTAGELRGGLAQLHIPQAHVAQGLELVADSGQRCEELHRLIHGHLQHIGNVLALVADLQGLPVVPPALAHLAGHKDVRQEVHLDLQHTVAGAGLAPAAPDVEAEPPRAVAPALGLLSGGEQVPDVIEEAGVGGGVGPGCPADGALVDVHHLVQILDSLDPVAPAGVDLHPVQLHAQLLEQDLIHQGALAAAGHAGNHGKGPQGELHVDVPQVVLRRADDLQALAVARPPGLRHGDPLLAGEILTRQAVGVGHDLLRCTGGHHLAAVDAGAGTDVDQVVRRPHGVLVVLHHQQGVAQVPQVLQRRQQLVVVPLVQTDGGLVQDIQHPHQAGADLGGQADPLALAAGEGPRAAAEGQIAQAHGLEEPQPGLDLLQDPVCDQVLLVRQLQPVHPLELVHHGHPGQGVDVLVPHGHRQGLLLQPLSLTGGTGALGHQLLQLPLAGIGLGLLVAALHVVADALKGLIQHALAPGLVVVELQLLPAGAVEDGAPHVLRQGLPGVGEGEVVFLRQGVEVHPGDAVPPDVVPAAGLDGPLQDGEGLVRHDQFRIHLQLAAQTRTGGTGTEGVVEGEHPGRQLLDGDAAVLAGIILGECQIPLLPQEVDDHQPAGEAGGGLHAVRQPLLDIRTDDEPVHHNLDGVLLVLLQLDLLVQLVQIPVHPGPDVAGPLGVLKDLGVLTLLAPDDGGHHLDAGALRQREDLIDDLVNGLLANLLAALGAVGGAHPGPQQAEVVVDLRHRAHGGPGVLAGGLLVNGDGGAETLDIVHIGLVHLAQEHPGIGAEGLHIPSLALGVDGVEGQGGLAGAGEARHDHQLVPGDGDVDILQIVGAGAFDDDLVLHNVYD